VAVARTWAFLFLLATGSERGDVDLAGHHCTVLAAIGFMVGFVGNPEFLWRGEYNSEAFSFYSDWTDAGLSHLGLLAGWWHVSARTILQRPSRSAGRRRSFLAGVVIVLCGARLLHCVPGRRCDLLLVASLAIKLWPHTLSVVALSLLHSRCAGGVAPAGWGDDAPFVAAVVFVA